MSQSIIEGFGGGLEARPAETGGLCLHGWLPVLPPQEQVTEK